MAIRMFVPYKFYKHDAMRDIAIYVEKAYYVKEKKIWKIKYTTWNVVTKGREFPTGTGLFKADLKEEVLEQWNWITL